MRGEPALEVGRRLSDHGVGVTVVDPVWALPVNPGLLSMAGEHQLVVTVEDNGIVGGCGARLAAELRKAGVPTPLREFGIEQEFKALVRRRCGGDTPPVGLRDRIKMQLTSVSFEEDGTQVTVERITVERSGE